MIYSYEAKDRTGRTVTGSLDALDERTAAMQVRDQGYFPTRLVAAPAASNPAQGYQREAAVPQTPMTFGRWVMVHFVYPVWSGVGLNDLALFYRQFAAMLRAGVPVYQCLTAFIAQTRNASLRRVLKSLSDRVQQGGTLSAGMGEFPWVFTDFHQAMVSAGEMTGGLDTMFARLADALEQEQTLRRKIRSETFYPKTVLVSSFLLPPLYYLITSGIGAYIHHAIVPLLILLGIVAALVVINKLGSQIRSVYDAFLAFMPGVAGTVRMIALARWARSLSSMYAAGVDLPRAIRLASDTCGNVYMGNKIIRSIPRLQTGDGITASLRDTGIFPPMVMSMVSTGEQTGSLDQTMDKVAEFYEQESVVRLHQTSVLLGVVAFLIAAVMVGIDVLNFYKGYAGQMNGIMNSDN